MFLTILLYVALIAFGAGLLYKIFNWFRYSISVGRRDISTSRRLGAAVSGILSMLFSAKILTLLKVFVLDVVLNVRILREDVLRWVMHMCLYGGFVLLLLMHALGQYTSAALFDDYYSTINPFLFLRDLFGVVVLVGVVIAVYRRFILRVPSLMSKAMDVYAIIIVAVIIVSGIVLQGTQVVSYSIYKEMVEDYSAASGGEEAEALEAYWVNNYGVVSPTMKRPFDEGLVVRGRQVHEMSCAECHARSQWGFASYGVAKVISPIAGGLDQAKVHMLLWYIHWFACLIGLAYLPFSKMFHLVASPVSLLANAVMDRGRSDPANIATRQMLELDACTHCGTCTSRCSVAAALEEIPNLNILPSEKILAIKGLAAGRELTDRERKDLQEGVYVCTNCYRCTVVCPVGINLQDLWFNVRETLLEKGIAEFSTLCPLSFSRGLMKAEMVHTDYQKPLTKAREAIVDKCELMKVPDKVVPLTQADRAFKSRLNLSGQASTFSVCFGCQTCTNVCPVVANYDNPQEILGLLPHQIMHACGLGVRDLAFGSNMLWDCLTCYQCQEQCPQGVCVTDVLYELKNLAVEYASGNTGESEGRP